jgi:hypothetical protein
MYFYHLAGLSVQSDIAFPGAIPADAGCAAEVTIMCAEVPSQIENVIAQGPTWSMSDRDFLLRVPGVARLLMSGGRTIRLAVDVGARLEDASAVLAGSALGILLHQRRSIVLHASAVEINGAAVLFCGASGTGKSTLAAALAQRGFSFVSDDLCVVSIEPPRDPVVHPDGRLLKLWAQAIDKLDLQERRGAALRAHIEKFYVEPARAASGPLRLGAIYGLREARPPFSAGVEKPNVVDAALMLRRAAYRPLLIARMGQKADYFQAAATICNLAGVYRLTRPLDFSAMGQVVGWLEGHWRDIGLLESAS